MRVKPQRPIWDYPRIWAALGFVNSNSSGVRILYVGGNYNSNDNYGFFYFNGNNNASNTNSNYGSRHLSRNWLTRRRSFAA